ncbi:hypothetical protein P0Y35_14920 [Kiritimatiellaeota bacterium B1221]|nr:hypothetical protein [Kiritimatiellaeota bacterium B1221]
MNNERRTDFMDVDLQSPRVPRPDFQAEEHQTREKLGQMQRQREHLEEEVADTARELHSLQQQQENLLKRKQSLESLRLRQERYVEEKQDLARRIHQCLLLLDKEEVRVAQLQDLYGNSRKLFSRLESQLQALVDGGWSEEDFDAELSQSADVVKGVRMEFKKGLARLDSLDWTSDREDDEMESVGLLDLGFGYWLKVGVALAIPIALLCGLSVMAALWILTTLGSNP